MGVTELLIAGGVAAGLIKIIDGVIQFALNRWGKNKDKKDESITVITKALKVIMLDRILYLGRAYIEDREVDADDRRRLMQMHDVYHSLGGNGDADLIMNCVKALQLKIK